MIEQLASKANHGNELSDSSSSSPMDNSSLQNEKPQATATATPQTHPEEPTGYYGLSSQLVAAWPGQRDLDLILSLSANISEFFSSSTCTPFSNRDTPSRDVLRLPPPGSHPVLIARKLLLLGSVLQGIRSCSSLVGGLSASHRDTIMSRAVETAHNLVTCNDDLVDSVEGIECLLMESMYHNTAGNLRRSWLAVRRAMLMAQLMGLQRGVRKVLELDTRACFDPTFLWFRLVRMDRYLSLMLGLSPGSLDDSFADPKALEGCTPMERMQRIQCVAAGRILQRNKAGTDDDLTSTHEIDKLLHEASSLMPPEWWLAPNAGDDMETLGETVRIMDLFTHHHLLARVHLPYLLRFSADHRYDYNKITAVNASREVLSRFVSFRKSRSATPYCRGVDFLAFIASTALCIAYIEARRHDPRPGDPRGCSTFFAFLVHQRLADRGMMESALEIMEFTAAGGTDKIASKIASVLRHLLDIEADAAAGGTYDTNSSRGEFTGGGGELEYGRDLGDGGNVLRIHIPYLGTIKIEGRGISKSSDLDPAVSLVPPEHHDKGQQKPQTANAWAGYQVGGQSVNPDWQAVSSNLGSVTTSELSEPTAKSDDIFASTGANGAHDAQLFVPGLAAAVDDWALQGVDLAFFDSLLCGVNQEGSAEGVSRGYEDHSP